MNPSIWAIGCWRNEADVARVNVLHHLSQGIDSMLILDHGSGDGTFAILEELSKRYPVTCRRESSIFRQDKILSRLAMEAKAGGADWIVPIDADEFWHAPGSTIREVLECSTADALSASVTNFVQHRSQQHPVAEALLTMTRSVINPLAGKEAESLVERGELPFLSYRYPRKHIIRASACAAVGWGNHEVLGVRAEVCEAIKVLHAPLRSIDCIARKSVLDRSDSEVAEYLQIAWHVRHWRQQIQDGLLEDEWSRNSYDDCGPADFVNDPTLRELVAPWLGEGILPFRRPKALLAPPPVRVWGISVVRNEVDIVQTTVEHHLSLGCERILVIDNGSADGTQAVLDSMAAGDPRISWRSDPGEFAQDRLITGLAHHAFVEGATWVLPFDADEFWCVRGPRSLKEILSIDDIAIRVPVVNYLQRRSQLGPSLDMLSGIAMRPKRAIGPVDAARRLVEDHEVPYVFTEYPPKWIVRASPFLRIGRGSHEIQGLEGRAVQTDEIICRHVPLRSRAVLEDKRDHGRRLNAQNLPDMVGWHVRRWASMSDDELDHEWILNSYHDDSGPELAAGGLFVRDPLARSVLTTQGSMLAVPERRVFRSQTTYEAEILACVSSVSGWLTADEALTLATAAVDCERIPACQGMPLILEVGAFCGKSTVAMAAGLRAAAVGGIIVSIDPHNGLVGAADGAVGLSLEASTAQVFAENLRALGLEPWVCSVRACSQEVIWNRRIEMLFLDSLHDEAIVALDLERFEPWLAVGGTLAVHDYVGSFPGVQRAVDALIVCGRFSSLRIVDSMAVLTKQSAGTSQWSDLDS